MKTKDFAEQVESLPKKHKMAILGIIDAKVETDMEKIMHKLDAMDTKISVLYWLIGALAVLMSIYKFLG
ncbi:hypothetical protein [Flagellimonas beolgyonensis]|uniref:hypothetical protein n=1 Tax=Flagellimonas beolgyonensis TaxID=864064 RepID=UPI000F8DCFCF|nr:hypothetical protein [Allomuricauda beolgyonensis]